MDGTFKQDCCGPRPVTGNGLVVRSSEDRAYDLTCHRATRDWVKAEMMSTREDDLDYFRNFVTNARWRFAKTYVETYPHEYTLQRWLDSDADAFSRAIQCIERWGVLESFWRAERKYLYLDERKYWHMGNAASENPDQRPTLINRTWFDVRRYREDAKTLGYDDASLDSLAGRWVSLLDKARRGV